MRKNQKGFTLVELIIAVAILSVVTVAVCGFIMVGSRSYTSANTDIMLQQDAQLALNQMSDVIIDTTESISYSGLVNGSMQMVLKDSEFSGEPTDKCLAVVNKVPETGDLNQNPSYWFYFSKDDATIYYNEIPDIDSATMTPDEIKDKFDAAATDKAVLAEHVAEFSVDVSQFEQNRVVMLSLTFENGERVYSTSNNVTVRNRIALNQITVGPMKRAKDFVIDAPDSITIEPGESYTFPAPTVTGDDVDKSVKWALLGEEKNGSTITADGHLTIGISETRKNFKVTVTRAAFDDSRSTKEVTVQVKRVTDVSLSCSAATVKAGDTVTINASAVGNYLGVKCDACNSSTEHDYDVENWKVITENAEEGTKSERTFKITIDSGLKEGDVVTIEASSLLSRLRNYGPLDDPTVPPVKGQLTLTLSKGNEGEYPIRGDMKFGTDNDPGILDYMRSNLKTDWGRYLFCVRVREMDATDAKDDRVVMYYTTGANERFFPDIFGLELNRSYKVFFQVLDPVSIKTRQKKASGEIDKYEEDKPEVIIEEYFKNCDPITGEYKGTKYEKDYLYSGLLNEPTITVKYKGVTYPNSLPNYIDYVALPSVGKGSGIINKFELGDAINIDKDNNFNGILNKVEYEIYKDDEFLYGYDENESKKNGKVTYVGNSMVENRMYAGVMYMEDRGGSMIIKRDGSDTVPDEAYGTYTVVPGFRYANSLAIRQYEYIYPLKNGQLDTDAFKREGRGGGDYEEHYYPQKKCKITVEIGKGLNLQLPSTKGEVIKTYFPVPSYLDFPFTRNLNIIQTKSWSFAAYNASGVRKSEYDLNNIKVDCQYVSDGGYYKLWLYRESGRDGASYKRDIIGIYSCKYGDNEWTPVDLYPNGDSITNQTNIDYTNDDGTWKAYFPYPSEGDFPFTGITEETTKSYSYVAYKSSNYDTQYETVDVICTHQNGVYTIEFVKIVQDNNIPRKQTRYSYGKWQCSDTGSNWDKIGQYEKKDQAIWGPTIEFTFNNGQKKAEFPLPGQNGFPSFEGDEFTREETIYYYDKNDTYGQYGASILKATVTYKKNSDGTYTITLRSEKEINDWRGHLLEVTTYGVWTSSADKWIQNEGQNGSSVEYKKVWDTLVHFSYDGKNYKMELPLPGADNFPKNEAAVYLESDESGSNRLFPYGEWYLVYTESGGNHEVQLRAAWGQYGGQEIAAWTCASNGTSWTKIR